MKRYIKIIIPFILLLVVMYFVINNLIIKDEDNKLDTSDLICERNTQYETYVEKLIYIFSFDQNAYVSDYIMKDNLVYNDLEIAKEHYRYYKKEGVDVKLEDKTIIFPTSDKKELLDDLKTLTKTELKKSYEEDLMYECN